MELPIFISVLEVQFSVQLSLNFHQYMDKDLSPKQSESTRHTQQKLLTPSGTNWKDVLVQDIPGKWCQQVNYHGLIFSVMLKTCQLFRPTVRGIQEGVLQKYDFMVTKRNTWNIVSLFHHQESPLGITSFWQKWRFQVCS